MTELETTMVIPDSIEPRRGYKALNYDDEGNLFSPSFGHIRWPAKRKLEATCPNVEWGWCPVEGEPRQLDATVAVDPAYKVWATATTIASSSVGSWGRATARPGRKPTNKLPEGWSWSWEALEHDVPSEDCTCGVYVVNEPRDAMSYLDRGKGCMVEVALWGRLIPGSDGARGQYAYPQRILSPRQLVPHVRPVSLMYGIPILVLNPLESEKVCAHPGCTCGDHCHATGLPRKDEVDNATLRQMIEDVQERATLPVSRGLWGTPPLRKIFNLTPAPDSPKLADILDGLIEDVLSKPPKGKP